MVALSLHMKIDIIVVSMCLQFLRSLGLHLSSPVLFSSHLFFFFFFSSKLVKYHENVRRAKTDYISSGLLQWPLSTSLPFNTWHKTLRRVLKMWNGDSGSGGERSSQRRLAAELRGYLMKCLRNEGA